MYQYRATCLAVVDGDTVDLEIDLGLEIRHRIRVRLYGIDTPELHSTVASERAAAQKARVFVIDAIFGRPLIVETIKDRTEKYGRYLANVFVEGVEKSVNAQLLEAGLAVSYFPKEVRS